MATATPTETTTITREALIDKLNEDLAREYQAIIAYVVYSQVLKGAEYMAIAKELEIHAGEELQHALTIAKQIDYLGGMPTRKAQPVKMTDDAREMLRPISTTRTRRFALSRTGDAVRGAQEYALAEHIREILRQEQEHQIDLATALGEDVPDMSKRERERVKGASTVRRYESALVVLARVEVPQRSQIGSEVICSGRTRHVFTASNRNTGRRRSFDSRSSTRGSIARR